MEEEDLGALHILVMVMVMVACLFLGFLLEKSGTHVLQVRASTGLQ